MQQKDLNPELKPSYENIYANVHFVKRGLDVMLNSLSYSTQNWIKKKNYAASIMYLKMFLQNKEQNCLKQTNKPTALFITISLY